MRSGEPLAPVVIALGSNLGDRSHHLRSALRQLSRVVTLVKLSSFVESEPVDAPPGSPSFLNAVVAGHTRLEAIELLREMQAIERRLGRRRPAPRNSPRTIDLDLIFYGAERISTPDLIVPHPRWKERGFVLEPLSELKLPWLTEDGSAAGGR